MFIPRKYNDQSTMHTQYHSIKHKGGPSSKTRIRFIMTHEMHLKYI